MHHLRRLLPYLRRYRSRYVRGLSLTVVASLVGAVSPMLVKWAIDSLEKRAPMEFILYAAGAIVAFAGVRSFLVFGGRFALISASRSIEYDLRNDIYSHLLRLPASWFDAHPTGDITSRCINDLEGARLMTGIGLQLIAGTGLIFLTSMVAMFLLNWRLAAAAFIPLSLITVVMAVTGRAMYDRTKAVQDQLGVISTRAQENFSGARVIKAFAQEEAEARRFDGECAAYLKANMSLVRLRGPAYALLTLLIELTIGVTLYVCGVGIMEGRYTIGELSAFTAYQFMLVWPMIAIGWVITIFQRGVACTARLFEVLDAPPAPAGGAKAGDRKPEFAGAVEIRNLSFRYRDDRPAALDGVSLSIAPGEKVGIVGRTGSGKSTLAALLLKLYPAPPGTIFVDGADLHEISTEALRRSIGAVTQDPYLFSDSIRNNIGFGSLDGLPNPEIDRAARLSRIAADIERFPDRMEQLVGERGVTLSGGQKQRTALARALLRRPSILILDDCLSSVDAHTEREILDELLEFMKGRTCIVITHRMSAVRDADRIIVLDEGRIVEIGTHDELVARGGLYARMCEQQRLLGDEE